MRSLRILCADDDPDVRRMLERFLTRAGHAVQYAVNGSDAWDILLKSSDHIDLVITDNQMPGFTGIKLTQLIRQSTYRGGLIVYCGALSRQDRASYVALKVDHIVLKNVNIVELLAVVERFASSASQSRN